MALPARSHASRCALLASETRRAVERDPGQTLTIPVRVHVVRGLEASDRGVELESWVTAQEIERVVLPEANRIWAQAGIRWDLAGVDMREVPPDRRTRRVADLLLRATRDAEGRADPRRVRRLDELLDVPASTDDVVHVYVVPYLGERSQGNASRRKRRVYLGSWTDKPSRGRRPPEKLALVEPEPLRHGSMGRTLAHELGHVLGLRHPDARTQRTFQRLMGGKRVGYRLTAEEIDTARADAR